MEFLADSLLEQRLAHHQNQHVVAVALRQKNVAQVILVIPRQVFGKIIVTAHPGEIVRKLIFVSFSKC